MCFHNTFRRFGYRFMGSVVKRFRDIGSFTVRLFISFLIAGSSGAFGTGAVAGGAQSEQAMDKAFYRLEEGELAERKVECRSNCEKVVGDLLKKYKGIDKVRQILIVVTDKDKVAANNDNEKLNQSLAEAYFYKKDQKNNWKMIFSRELAYIGKNGAGKAEEGDGKTPLGDFNVLGAFGIKDKPRKVKLPYIKITPETYACSDDCDFYNKIINLDQVKHDCKGERMIDYVPHYNYGLVIDFNKENDPSIGSNIFVHCYGKEPYTAGCVALSEENVLSLLRNASQLQMVVSIV